MTLAELRDRYLETFNAEPGAPERVERALDVVLPKDLKEICSFFPGQLLGGISNRELTDQGSFNVVEITEKLRRSRGLPSNVIILAEPSESVVLLRLGVAPAVVWCAAHDLDRVARGEPATSDVDSFETYSDYFEYLLEAEQEEAEE